VAVLTGTGRAFCAGADLKEWDDLNRGKATDNKKPEEQGDVKPNPFDKPSSRFPRGGFGGMSNRGGMKPIIAAVNGICFGGGMEMAINCDLVIADGEKALFSLPEVTIGVVALAGALPRLARSVGRQRAAEMALGGGRYDARTMKEWGLVNEVVGEKGKVVERAVEWARKLAGNSPDAVVVSREGLKLAAEGLGPEQATEWLIKGWYERIEKGENMLEGVKSFVERRKPLWKDSKL
jgi:enoyl-CoA hydratase/carnithine racemase